MEDSQMNWVFFLVNMEAKQKSVSRHRDHHMPLNKSFN